MTKETCEYEDSEFIKYKNKRMKEINSLINTNKVQTYTDEYKLIQKSKTDTMIVHFFDDRFTKCKIMDNNLERVSTYFKGVEFIRIDANLCPNFVKKLKITTLPYLGFFRDGYFVDHTVGFEGFGHDSFEVEDLVSYIRKSELFKK
ncbi:hypothetical protein BDAP_002151 [Binucleata daphniae]